MHRLAKGVVRLYIDALSTSGSTAVREESGEPDVPAARLSAGVVVAREVVRRGVEGLLRAIPEVGPIHGCGSPDELTRLLALDPPQVMVVAAADADWLHPHRDLLGTGRPTVQLMVDEESVTDLARYAWLPVDGYLWQPSLTVPELRVALGERRRGQVPMPPALVRALFERVGDTGHRSRLRPVRLTGREREALTFLVQGLSNKQIAKRLSISSHGAKRLVASVMLKLDAPNRTMAAVTAIRTGLVQVP